MNMKSYQSEDTKLVSLFQTAASAATKIQKLPHPSTEHADLDSEEFGNLREHLNTVLQTTLDLEEICQLFFEEVQFAIPLDSLTFEGLNDNQAVSCGRISVHKCNYGLIINREKLGEVSFTRRKRFSEQELGLLETLIALLIYPLRNGLMYQEALQTAMKDPLTDLGSRAAMASSLCRDIELAQRHHQPFAVLLMDIDKFKSVNDEYGHSAGDEVLKSVAKAIKKITRQTDESFRYGGEEFLLVLDKADDDTAERIAERLRSAVQQLDTYYHKQKINTSVSIGIATVRAEDTTESLFNRADKALYHAKQGGRNQVVNSNSALQEAASNHLS